MQVVVGGNVIITFGRVDVELTQKQAGELKVLLVNALERSERDFPSEYRNIYNLS